MDLRTGRILPSFRKAVYDEIIDNVSSNTSHYYAFAAVTDKTSTGAENTADNDYVNQFTSTWKILFGKKLTANNFIPVIKKKTWAKNTIYDLYDNFDETLHSNSTFYVISPPAITGAPYHVYKCIDNANGAPSTVKPSIVQQETFQTPDKYKWRYITSISYKDFQNYSTTNYAPIFANSAVTTSAAENSGVETVLISNSGVFLTYHDGVIKSTPSVNLLQISDDAYNANNFYTKSSIYVYTEGTATANVYDISEYRSNTSGKWISLSQNANLTNIIPGLTKYKISPKVIFNTDGTSNPVAYSVVNVSTNTIHAIVVLDKGTDISWANVELQCNAAYKSNISLQAVVPPPGGHGANPAVELDMQGVSINFSFANNENTTIPTQNIVYDTVGILKNPYFANNSNTLRIKTTDRFWSNTMSQLTKGTVSLTFSVGERVTGNTSGAIGEVVFANSSQVYITGDKYFVNEEYIVAANGVSTRYNITAQPQIYTKDIVPLYVQYINTIERPIENTQTESFNLLLQF